MRPMCPAGIATACPSNSMSRRRSASPGTRSANAEFREEVPPLRRAPGGHTARGVPAHGGAGRLEQPLPDHGLRSRRISCGPWRASSSGATCTRASSPCTGAPTAVRRSRKRRWNTRTSCIAGDRRGLTSAVDPGAVLAACGSGYAGELADVAPIWTTTPWTLPANMAVSLHPDLEYVLIEGRDRALLVAAELVPRTVCRRDRPGKTGSWGAARGRAGGIGSCCGTRSSIARCR